MKKHFLGLILTVALVAISVFCLSACGGNKVVVDLRGKVYTFSTEQTWTTYYHHSDGSETPIDNPEQWLADNWDLLADESDKVDFSTGLQRTPAQLIDYYKAILFNGNTDWLDGATVTVGNAIREDDSRCYCNATVVKDGQTLAEEEIYTQYASYYKGYVSAFNDYDSVKDQISVSISDFYANTGEIKEVSVTVTRPLPNGGIRVYSNKMATSMNLTIESEFFCLRCEYELVSITDIA